jgi:hypothetical protein
MTDVTLCAITLLHTDSEFTSRAGQTFDHANVCTIHTSTLLAIRAPRAVTTRGTVTAETLIINTAIVVLIGLAIHSCARGANDLHIIGVPVLGLMVGTTFNHDLNAIT